MGLLDVIRQPRVQQVRPAARPPAPAAPASCVAPPAAEASAAATAAATASPPPVRYRWQDGEKFPGGWGPTDLWTKDYWTLRARSAELFERNLYGRGLIRRLVENEVNTGLHLEATPEEVILGRAKRSLSDWSEDVENRFALWGKNPAICDAKERLTFGALQAEIRREALIGGDVLVVMKQDQRTKLPRLEVIPGESVQTPWERVSSDIRIEHGVELDGAGRHVAYHVRQKDGSSKRLPAFGEKSGRRLAWLVYGTDKRVADVRGTPLLGVVLQALKELDRYRDAALRKSVINSMIALIVKKSTPGPGSGMGRRAGVASGTTTSGATGETPRTFAFSEQIPGAVVEELNEGEEPTPFPSGADIDFGEFEKCVVAAIAWTEGIPPEILTLSFSNNYSASQAAINEFKLHLNLARTDFGEQVCQLVYVEWLLASALAGKVKAPGLLESFRNYELHDQWGAWVSADWSGHIKPAVDMSKLIVAYAKAVEQGFITRDRATRELFGMKHSKVVQQLAIENEELAKALEFLQGTLLDAKPTPKAPPPKAKGGDATDDNDDTPADENDAEEPADDSAEKRPN
jgi:capsid protein